MGRDEIGGLYLPSQVERTQQCVRDGVPLCDIY
jgi:hypothetical protein